MFKKVCVVVFSLILLFSLAIFNNAPVFSDYSCEYEIYLANSSNINSVKTVNKKEYFWQFAIVGESCVIENKNFCLNDFFSKLNAKELFSENVGDIAIYYAYSPQIKYCERVNGKTVNLQVAVSKEYIKVGSPLIYGSF